MLDDAVLLGHFLEQLCKAGVGEERGLLQRERAVDGCADLDEVFVLKALDLSPQGIRYALVLLLQEAVDDALIELVKAAPEAKQLKAM